MDLLNFISKLFVADILINSSQITFHDISWVKYFQVVLFFPVFDLISNLLDFVRAKTASFTSHTNLACPLLGL